MSATVTVLHIEARSKYSIKGMEETYISMEYWKHENYLLEILHESRSYLLSLSHL